MDLSVIHHLQQVAGNSDASMHRMPQYEKIQNRGEAILAMLSSPFFMMPQITKWQCAILRMLGYEKKVSKSRLKCHSVRQLAIGVNIRVIFRPIPNLIFLSLRMEISANNLTSPLAPFKLGNDSNSPANWRAI